MHETFKDVELQKRKFRIGKFDALTGSYVAFVVISQLAPLLGKEGNVEGEKIVTSAPSILPKEVFFEIQKSCLQVCSEIVMVGNVVTPMPVMLKDGRWGIDGIENDAGLAMMLTVQVLGFNMQSFFAGNALEGFKSGISQLNLSNA